MVTKQTFTIQTAPIKSLGDKFDKLRASLSDMRPLFEQFAADFYKDEKRIFKLKSPGKYDDLSTKYAASKLKRYGFKYPILFATGRLANSLLTRNAPESVLRIKKDIFFIGTSTPYAVYHHSTDPRKKIPRRQVYFFGEKENPQQARRWRRMIQVYVDKAVKGAFR